jgi:hypothetical protein
MATKLSTAKIDQLDALNDTLEIARQAVIDLCEGLCDTTFLSHWEIAPALTAWKAAAEAWNDAVYDAAVDVRSFMEEHSEKWLESERGLAYEAWAEALDNAQVETEPGDYLRLSLTIDLESGQIESSVENAEEIMPDTPDIPELDA